MNTLILQHLSATGIAFDIVGAIILARGLLPSMNEVHVRGTWHGLLLTPVVVIKDRIDGIFGLAALVIGFSMQLVAYVVTSGWALADGQPSSIHAVAIVAVAAAAAQALLLFYLALRPFLFKRWLVRTVLAGASGVWGEDVLDRLMKLGTASGLPSIDGEAATTYAFRVFGVRMNASGSTSPSEDVATPDLAGTI